MHDRRVQRWGSTDPPPPRRGKSLEERFWAKVQKTETCWLWIGTKNTWGYGNLYTYAGLERRQLHMAHRVSYELAKGPIPSGLVIDHLCRNTSCVNPGHLEAVTSRENGRRGVGPAGRWRLTHCKRGHEFTPENTRITSRGTRACRACQPFYPSRIAKT